MALFLSVGNELLSPDELIEKHATGEIERIEAESKETQLLGFPSGEKTKFTRVGLGHPLSIEIRKIFTGNLPNPGFFMDRKKDLLVTTSHKPITQVKAAARALNLVRENVDVETSIDNIAAIEVGTPIVYYSPAMVESSVSVTVDFGFEEFPKRVFTMLSNALRTAAGIPAFATSSMYLLAGGVVTGLVADLGKALFEKGPEFVGSDTINFERAGEGKSIAGYGVLFSDDAPSHLDKAYKVDPEGALVHKQTQKPYAEQHPYVIVSLDGGVNKSYEKFQQTAATADLLARFYNVGENRAEPVDVLLQGLQYYSDLKYRREAEEVKAEIDGGEIKGEKLEKLKERHKALLENILTNELKPS